MHLLLTRQAKGPKLFLFNTDIRSLLTFQSFNCQCLIYKYRDSVCSWAKSSKNGLNVFERGENLLHKWYIKYL